MSKEELNSIEVTAWKLQFYNLFSKGKEMVEKSIKARFFNDNPSENFSPQLQIIFWNTLEEFIGKNPNCNLDEILSEHSTPPTLGEEAQSFDPNY